MSIAIITTKREKRKIAEQFRKFRRRYGFSQEVLARMMGVSRRTVANVEAQGPNGATFETVERFRQAREWIRNEPPKTTLRRVPR